MNNFEACPLIFFSAQKQYKWKSAWDLTEKEKEKHKDKKKRKKSLVQIQQGLLDLMNISDPAVSGDNTQLRALASVKMNQHGVRRNLFLFGKLKNII